MYSNNFGVIEVAGPKTTVAPGWAYVADVGLGRGAAALPSNRKRARNQGPNLSGADLSARQEAKNRREIEALDRDNNRDVNIPIPPSSGGSRALNKSTPNVRKILQSQKTFANHLDDYEAFLSHSEHNPSPHPNQHTSSRTSQPNQHSRAKATQPNQYTKKAPQPNQYTKKNAAAAAAAAATPTASDSGSSRKGGSSRSRSRRSLRASETEATASSPAQADTLNQESQDVEMTDIPDPEAQDSSGPSILQPYNKAAIPSHPGDDDPLLASVVPDMPSEEELRKLMTHPPLSYTQARAKWSDEERQYPVRHFCELCGYWGRIRCMKCGTRICALDCLEVHREECVTRYGI